MAPIEIIINSMDGLEIIRAGTTIMAAINDSRSEVTGDVLLPCGCIKQRL
jgi:hypothetical protein